MAMPVCESCSSEFELEGLPEFESEFEFEGEFEGEGELEGEGFFGDIAGALLGEQEFEGEFEDEGEFEFEGEFEAEGNPIRRIYSDAMMEHLGELAAEAESEQEAVEHMSPAVHMAASKILPVLAKAVAPAARRAAPHIAKVVTRAAPHLTRAVGKITRTLHQNPRTRPLLRALPTITRRAVHSVARQAAHGRPVSPRTAVRTLARHARHVLGNPRHRAHALRHHRRMDRRFHHSVGRRMHLPHWRYGGRGGVVGAPVPGSPLTYVTTPGAAPVRQVRHVTRGGRPVRQVRYVGGRAGAPITQVLGRPGVVTRVAGPGGVCPPCPVCGTPGVTSAPAYCRCCGQVLR
jgi:hypothetical protein